MSTQRGIRLVFCAGLLAWITTAVLLWASSAPLGDNEALYARAAQLRLEGVQPRWNYLSTGMSAIAAPGVLAGGGERALRALPLLLGIGFVLASALLARRTTSDGIAAWLVCLIAGSLSIAKRSADLLSDLPSTALLLLGLAILTTELEREEGPSRRVLWIAPVFAAAMYVRYGSCIPIAIIGVTALGFGWRAVRTRPLPLIGSVGLFALLMVPHFLESRAVTGSALGFLLDGNDVLRIEYRGVGLVGFVENNPFLFYGVVTTPLMILGLLSIIRPRDRCAVMLWVIAVADIVALGMTTVAESRYIFLAIVLLLILGADVVYRFIAAKPATLRKILVGSAAVAVAASWLTVMIPSIRIGEHRRTSWQSALTAAAIVRQDSAGARCEVVARHTSQVEWYSGCDAILEVPALGHERVYLVRDDFGDFQPEITNLPGHQHTLLDRPDVLVLRLDP